MPEQYLPDNFDLFRYNTKIGGHIYKGTPQIERNGRKTMGGNLGEYLRIGTSDERAVTLLKRHYGKEAKIENGMFLVKELRVYLPYRELSHNFVAAYGEFSKGGGLQRFCDGQTLKIRKERVEIQDSRGQSRPSWHYPKDHRPCPAAESHRPCVNCNYIRRLSVFIAELYDVGYKRLFVLNTVAINEIQLLHSLEEEEMRLQRFAPGANISFLPYEFTSVPETDQFTRWVLSRRPEKIGKPGTKKEGGKTVFTGSQVQSEEWLLSLTIDQDWWNTAMSRVGRGRYRLDRDTGKAVSLEDERLNYLKEMADAANRLAMAGQNAMPFLFPGAAPPPIAVLPPAEKTIPQGGTRLDGSEAIPIEVAEIIDCEDAPFRPQNTSDGSVANRLMAVAQQIGITSHAVAGAIHELYGDRHSSELTDIHVRRVIRYLLCQWATTLTYPDGEPVFLSMEEAEAFMESRPSAPHEDTALASWWVQQVQQHSR